MNFQTGSSKCSADLLEEPVLGLIIAAFYRCLPAFTFTSL